MWLQYLLLRIIILVALEEDPLSEAMDMVIEEEKEDKVEILIEEFIITCVVS